MRKVIVKVIVKAGIEIAGIIRRTIAIGITCEFGCSIARNESNGRKLWQGTLGKSIHDDPLSHLG